MKRSISSQMPPKMNCAPWKPVRMKNDEPMRFVWIVSPSCTNDVNSYAWKPRNVAPRIAVEASQILDDRRSPRTTAECASTIASDDISSTNVETDVTGMFRIALKTCPVAGSFHTSCGIGPTGNQPQKNRNNENNNAKKKHSEPMNAQMATFVLL